MEIKKLPRILPFTKEHDQFKKTVDEFYLKEVVPYHEEWEKNGVVSRDVWKKAGAIGIICPNFPEEYGGAGVDFLYNVIVMEASGRHFNTGFFVSLHGDVIAPYILEFANDIQKRDWLPNVISGEKILAVAMTEPSTGSDLGAIKTTAIDKGDYYLVNGSKTFISNGTLADYIITVVKHENNTISLLMVESHMEGYKVGKHLRKIGLHAQDTAELSFVDVKVPKKNLIGKQGSGFRYLMQKLQQERLVLSIENMASAEKILEITIQYVKERTAFGKSIGQFQNTRFKLADIATEQAAARAFLDQVILEHMKGNKAMVQASQAKLLCSEMLKRHVDTCLQFFGGYGYMMEYPIARAYIDARVQTIYAGTSEIMKEIIASKGLNL